MPEIWATLNGREVELREITHWRCPHCQMHIALANVADHVEALHPRCLGCELERMLCMQIIVRQRFEADHTLT